MFDDAGNITIGGNHSGNIAVPGGSVVEVFNINFKIWRDVVPNQVGARIRAERINNWQPNNALKQSTDLTFSTSFAEDQTSLTEKMRIKDNGSVGIGTVNPLAKLDVRGLILASEIKVEVSTWPDYVFAPDYPIMTLEQVKHYIDKNHHLPEIPSGKETIEKGAYAFDRISEIDNFSNAIFVVEKSREIHPVIQPRIKTKWIFFALFLNV